MKDILRLQCLALLLFTGFSAQAQLPTVDITMHETGTGSLEVRVRPDAFFDGVFSSVVFTVRWLDADGVSLGLVSQVAPESMYCGVAKSGPETVDGIFRYQVFAGFGVVPLSGIGVEWTAGEEVVLCTIVAPNGGSLYQLVEDDWTAGANGDYFVSLNGQTRTGVIYMSTTEADASPMEGGFRIGPIPSTGTLRLERTHGDPGVWDLELIDAGGRAVWTDRRVVVAGPVSGVLEFGEQADGLYVLRVTTPEGVHTHRVIIKQLQ